jgi:biotin operon repressor
MKQSKTFSSRTNNFGIMGNPVINIREAANYQPPIAKKAFQALSLLQDWITIDELGKSLNVSKGSVHRYLNMFVSFGFKVKVDCSKCYRYKIVNTAKALKAIREQSIKP